MSGPTNSLCDLSGLLVGHAEDRQARTGSTVIVFDRPATASVSILGQAPGTRDMAALDPARTVQAIDALVLSGGSAFGLAAADPVMQALRDAGRGFAVGTQRVPIVPAAILFDLANGGDKPDDLGALYRHLGEKAFKGAARSTPLGAEGAGFGASTATGAGGLGTASTVFTQDAPEPLRGRTIGALVAVNAVGSPHYGNGPHLRAAPFELGTEFGGLGCPAEHDPEPRLKPLGAAGANTTIGCVVTDVPLDKAACHALAVAGQDGIASAIFPAHTALDGDLVVGASVSDGDALTDPPLLALLQAAATATMARAIARGVHAASTETR